MTHYLAFKKVEGLTPLDLDYGIKVRANPEDPLSYFNTQEKEALINKHAFFEDNQQLHLTGIDNPYHEIMQYVFS